MGEKTGFLTLLLLFAIGILPLLLNMFETQVKSSRLLALSNEINQLIVAEGDITPNVQEVVNTFSEKGIDIEFRDKNNNLITSSPGIGEKIIIVYKYDGLETTNSAVLTKRVGGS